MYICLKEVNAFIMIEDSGKGLVLTRSVYKEIFMEYYKPLCLFARKILSCEDDAEDMVHNVFLALWEKKMSFIDKSHLKAYLFQAVYNQSITNIRKRRLLTDLQEEYEKKVDENNYLRTRIESEIFFEIMEAVENLPKQRREIFKLSYIEGLKISEVAARIEYSGRNRSVTTGESTQTTSSYFKRSFFFCPVDLFSARCLLKSFIFESRVTHFESW